MSKKTHDAAKTWAITQDMMNGKFTTDAKYAKFYTNGYTNDRCLEVKSQGNGKVSFHFVDDDEQMSYDRTVSNKEFEEFLSWQKLRPGTSAEYTSYVNGLREVAARNARYRKLWG